MRLFIGEHRPEVIGVAAESLGSPLTLIIPIALVQYKESKKYSHSSSESRRIFTELQEICILLEEEMLQSGTRFRRPMVTYVEPDVARIFADSKRAKEQLSADEDSVTLRAISIGRRLIEPLAEFCALVNSEGEIHHLPLDPLQSIVPQQNFDEKIEVRLNSLSMLIHSAQVDLYSVEFIVVDISPPPFL